MAVRFDGLEAIDKAGNDLLSLLNLPTSSAAIWMLSAALPPFPHRIIFLLANSAFKHCLEISWISFSWLINALETSTRPKRNNVATEIIRYAASNTDISTYFIKVE